MDKSSLKAREIEALTFIHTPVVTPERMRKSPARVRPSTLGAAVLVIVVAALAWFLSPV